jgi:outer membrane receptor protein involved in Fe transport
MLNFFSKAFVMGALLWCVVSVYPQGRVLRGTVLDEQGAVITNAKVKISTNGGEFSFCKIEEKGKFSCEISFVGDFTLEIEAPGFSILRQNYLKTQDVSVEQSFTMRPAELREERTVTANRIETRIGETPASIVMLPRAEIETSAAPTMDDTLRQVAGFSIFRRSSSRNANPTTQGVSLRGVGASGASRSLVLFDGVPLNDPFGGWVQWNRVSPIGVERAEVLRGGASSLYGNGSLSGTINLIPRVPAEKYVFSAEAFGGTQNTMSGSVFTGFHLDDWTADLTAASFQTKGYIPVDEAARGPADSFAGVRSTNFTARLRKSFGGWATVFFRPSFFGEVRTNGTGLQTNRTHTRQFSAGGDFDLDKFAHRIPNSRAEWQLYGGAQVYDQVFSAVNATRTTESLNRVQRVPAQVFGFSGRFSSSVKNHALLFGIEARAVRGASDETAYVNGLPTSMTGAGGRERTLSGFVQDFVRVGSRLVVAGSVRLDSWENSRGLISTRTLASGLVTTTIFPDRRESALSPQISFLYRVTDSVSIQAQASKSFRAPTLNELYRNFRVGNVLTLANENLEAEHADNFEAGLSYNRKTTSFRGTFYWTEVHRPVSNVTLNTTPTLITRQRQNAGRTRAAGLELEAEGSVGKLNMSLGYLFADSRVTEFLSNSQFVGLAVPQVPKHQFTFQARYPIEKWTFALQGRASSAQFDDDLNLFRLEPYFQADLFISRRVGENLSVFTGIENLFNSRYSVGRTPIRTVASPINIRAGFRWK